MSPFPFSFSGTAPADFKTCRNNTYVGTLVPAGAMTQTHPYCTSITVVKPNTITCALCDTFVHLVATLFTSAAMPLKAF